MNNGGFLQGPVQLLLGWAGLAGAGWGRRGRLGKAGILLRLICLGTETIKGTRD